MDKALCKIITKKDYYELLKTGFVPDQPEDKEIHVGMAADLNEAHDGGPDTDYCDSFIHCIRNLVNVDEAIKKRYGVGKAVYVLILDERELEIAGFRLVDERNPIMPSGGERPHLYRTTSDVHIPLCAVLDSFYIIRKDM